MREFNQPMAKYHAMDMFDFEHSMRDCVTLAELAVPVLAATFGPSADEESEMQVEVDPMTPLTVGDIQPVWKAITGLCWMIYKRIHIRQMAGNTTVGYVPMYTHILKLKDGYKSFSSSCSDSDHWNIKKLELEKDIFKERAHIKQIAAATARSGSTPRQASVSGPSGQGG